MSSGGVGSGTGDAPRAGGGETFLTEPDINYDELVNEDDELGLEIMISGVTETTQSTLMLKKKKEMRAVDDALDFMKEEFRKRMEACDEREARFKDKQAEMKAMVLRFQQFIQENDAKRARAEAKATSEAQTCAKLTSDAKQLQTQLASLQEEKAALELRLESLGRYTRYLDGVVNHPDSDYSEVSELLNRYRNLRDANEDLHREVEKNKAGIEATRAEVATKRREGETVGLTLSSEAQQLIKSIEEMTAKSAVLDITRDQTDAVLRDQQLVSGKVVTAVHSLYMRSKLGMRGTQKPLPAAGKERSTEYLMQCLQAVDVRMDTLAKVIGGYAEYIDNKAKEAARLKALAKAEAAAAAGAMGSSVAAAAAAAAAAGAGGAAGAGRGGRGPSSKDSGSIGSGLIAMDSMSSLPL